MTLSLRTICVTLAMLAVATLPLRAQGLIRDAEIERTLRLMATPLLRQAGISPRTVNLYIVNNDRMNAFVTPSNNLFIHSGLIKRLKTPEMLQAVIAHEIGHLAGNHISQRQISSVNAKTNAGLGLLLALAVAATGNAEGAAGLAAGTNSAAGRNLLANTRSQETAADRSGVRYMAGAGIDPKAALDVLELFKGQNLLTARRQDPYVQTHPLSNQRINDLKSIAGAQKISATAKPKNLDYWYVRMVSKFNGFTNNPAYTLRRLKKGDNSEATILARAIAYHKKPDPKRARAAINKLLKLRPNDAFYWELSGQFLLENGDAKSAVSHYRKAVNLAPDQALLLAGLGRALNAVKSKEALGILQKAYAKDPRDARMLRELSLAFARAGKRGNASLATAERYALGGNFKQAKIHAKRASDLLPSGSRGWIKAQDILSVAERVAAKKS